MIFMISENIIYYHIIVAVVDHIFHPETSYIIGLEHFIFSYIGECRNPNWRTHILQRGRLNHQPDRILPISHVSIVRSSRNIPSHELLVVRATRKNHSVLSRWGPQNFNNYGLWYANKNSTHGACKPTYNGGAHIVVVTWTTSVYRCVDHARSC